MRRRPPTPTISASAIAATALTLLLGCSGGDAAPSGSEAADAGAEQAQETGLETGQETGAGDDAEVPADDLGRQVTWVTEALDPDTPASTDDVIAHVSEATLAQISADDLRLTLTRLGLTGPWQVVGYEADQDGALATIRDTAGTELELTLTLAQDGLIHTLLFQEPYTHTEATTWQELSDAVDRLPADTTLVVTRLGEDGVSEPAFAVGEQEAWPIGSVFKVYVLGALTQAVADGTIGWQDELAVTDELRSLPTGRLQDAETGTVVTVREAAELMISISDNTATDLLIDALGRERVEAAVVAMGHARPELLTPFPSTREMFHLAWAGAAPEREERRARWREASADERRTMLADLPETLAVEAEAVTDAAWPDGLDWFADADDLTAAWAWLRQAAGTTAGAPLPEILAMNPGLPEHTAAHADQVWFKGGSAPGELALSWLVRGRHGGEEGATGTDAFVVTLQARHAAPMAVADARPYAASAADAVRLALEGEG